MKELWHVFEHSFLDAIKLFPWLLLIYIVIELLERKTKLATANGKLSGALGPLFGSATGLIPQCGFSVMAAKLFEKKYVTIGTLLAIFTATSDEAFILLLSSADGAVWLLPLIAVKLVTGILLGYAADGVIRLVGRGQRRVEPVESENKTGGEQSVRDLFFAKQEEADDGEYTCSCGRSHEGEGPLKNYFLYPLLHTLKIFAFILVVNFVLGLIVHYVTLERFSAFMQRNRFLQPVLTALVGLIPNCASSVVITNTFLQGGISFGALAAGLCANAGLGFLVLLKNTKEWKRNLLMIVTLYLTAVGVGLLLTAFL